MKIMTDDTSIETSEAEAKPYTAAGKTEDPRVILLVGDEPTVVPLEWHDATGDARPEKDLGVIVWISFPQGPTGCGPDDWKDWQPGRWNGEAWLNYEGMPFPEDAVITHWAEPLGPHAS